MPASPAIPTTCPRPPAAESNRLRRSSNSCWRPTKPAGRRRTPPPGGSRAARRTGSPACGEVKSSAEELHRVLAPDEAGRPPPHAAARGFTSAEAEGAPGHGRQVEATLEKRRGRLADDDAASVDGRHERTENGPPPHAGLDGRA